MKAEFHCELGQAPREDPQEGRRRIERFLSENASDFISERPAEALERTAEDGGLFFVDCVTDQGRRLAACSARYDEGGYFEFGTTRIAEEFQGCSLQCAIYLNTAAHVLLDRLPEKGIFAIVHRDNIGSIKNLKKAGFLQTPLDEPMAAALPNKNWQGIRSGEKLLFRMPGTAMAHALRHVSEVGRDQFLWSRDRDRLIRLHLNFRWAEEADDAASLLELAESLRGKYPV